ncbi:MAG: thiamine pyrophosphate-dependent enzyme [Gammaproteobacteria bacterium]|nr:thiamine pyrophosphate-dependent enzyme [Gammaproteobacteria bacterium]
MTDVNATLNLPAHERLARVFRERVGCGDLPVSGHNLTLSGVGLTPADLVHVFESQLMSRHLDYAARRLGQQKRGFYSIGSAGHEGNAGVAHVFRSTDMAFLHYRSAAFLIERLRQKPGATPLWDMALSFVASSEDPVSGGRHKVLGSHEMFVPPQTSTIASHLPKAVGTSFAVSLARMLKADFSVVPHDSVVIASFGDASVNHSTAVGALNTAALTAHRGIPLPILLICEDNGIGISVPTPSGWVAGSYEGKQGLHYIAADGTEILDVIQAAREAEHLTRERKTPVFLHLDMVRLMGHAGSDVESTYRPLADIKSEEARDPLLKTARTLIDEQVMTAQAILDLDQQIAERVQRVTDQACERPKLTSARNIMRSIVPDPSSLNTAVAPNARPFVPSSAIDIRALETPQHLSRLISLTLAGILAEDSRAVVFGEDVGKKGGVYGATTRLQTQFGNRRVFDTPLDEQSILGLAIGLAHNGFIPLPEIQFLAYVHNAEDQIRGEAATLSFFSDGKAANPMVIRIAGLAYQRGFGGHFHNDNALGVFRDIPGIVLACPSRGDDAVRMLRCCYRLAREQGRVVVFLEPIALYNVKDLIADGDGDMSFVYTEIEGEISFGELGVEDSKPAGGRRKKTGNPDIAIVSYANGAYLSRRAIKRLTDDDGLSVRLIDLRWLKPLDIEAILTAIGTAEHVLVVDECRRTGSLSEELITGFVENGCKVPFARLCAEDSFIPLGTAAYEVLPSEAGILTAARDLLGIPSGQQRRGA